MGAAIFLLGICFIAGGIATIIENYETRKRLEIAKRKAAREEARLDKEVERAVQEAIKPYLD